MIGACCCVAAAAAAAVVAAAVDAVLLRPVARLREEPCGKLKLAASFASLAASKSLR